MFESMKTEGRKEDARNNVVEEQKRKLAKEAARNAGSNLADATKAGAAEFKTFVVENPTGVKTIGLLSGFTLLIFSLLALINIMNMAYPTLYIVNAFNMLFGFMILVVEGPAQWKWCRLRKGLFTHFGFLGKPVGRMMFYFYIGAMVVSMAAAWWPFYVLGAALLFCGVMQLIGLCKKGVRGDQQKFADDTENTSDDV